MHKYFISWLNGPFLAQINSDSLDPAEKAHLPVTLVNESLKNQTKAVLLAELVSMELFYGLEDLVKAGPTGMAQGFTNPKLYSSLTDRDLLLQSAETLLEVMAKMYCLHSTDYTEGSEGSVTITETHLGF